MFKKKALENKVLEKISRKKGAVFVRADFKELGGYDQVGRALRNLVRKEKIAKIGYGLYAKTKLSSISGKQILMMSLPRLGREAVERLGIKVVPSKMEEEYNRGKSTQVPTGRVIGVEGRISRKIGYQGVYVSFERHTKQSSL
jgi:hypothetical protein